MNYQPVLAKTEERALIGAALSLTGGADELLSHLTSEDFFDPILADLFNRIKEVRSKGVPAGIDTVLVAMSEEEMRLLAPVMGDLICESPGSVDAMMPYLKHVGALSRLRKMQSAMSASFKQIEALEGNPEEIIKDIEANIFKAAEKQVDTEIRDIDEIIDDACAQILESMERKKKGVTDFYVSSGIDDLDHVLVGGGFKPGQFVVIAARPGCGKSIIAVQIARKNAKAKKKIGMISLEMTDVENVFRMAAAECGVSMSLILDGDLERTDELGTRLDERVDSGLARLKGTGMKMITCGSLRASEMRSKARRLKARYGIDALIVDYIQQVKGDSKKVTRQVEVGEVTRACKCIAMELKIPVIGLAQIRRGKDKPTLDDLRESGDIEQDADIVAMLWRRDQSPDQKKNSVYPTNIGLEKQRNGPTGDILVELEGRFCRFVSPKRTAV